MRDGSQGRFVALRHLARASVITDTECRGSSTEKLFPALIGPPVVLTASGVANPFTAASESATTRVTTASEERFAPRTLIRVSAAARDRC